jgi:TRAP-type C4-dicarboxylate transport system substrate-binding protein
MQNVQATTLGMNPVSASYAEMFESLERGVVDCTMGSLNVAQLGGFLPAAPHFAFDPETGIQSPGGSIAFGLDRWNSLPLPAQQLLYDRMDVLLGANLEATWAITAAGVAAVEDAGGEIALLDDDAVDVLRAANDDALDNARSAAPVQDPDAFVEALLENTGSWGDEVAQLGIEGVDVSYDDFSTWHEAGAPDLQSFFDALWERALDERRPS